MTYKRPRLQRLPINKLIPNILTISALCAGMTSINFAFRGLWEEAVFAIVIAAVLDALDGRIARMLNAQSKFGAELDSLSDFISFGVAPPMILYLWVLQDAGKIGWVFVLFFTVCMALRLARFNTALDDPDEPAWKGNFFTGVPAPAGALLILYPLALSFLFGESFFRTASVTAIFITLVGGLMVSQVPTFSFKKVKVPHSYVLPMMLCVGLFIAFLVTEPWALLVGIGAVYLGSFPMSWRSYRKWAGKSENETDPDQETPSSDKVEKK